MSSLSTTVSHSREQKRARSTSEHSVVNLSTLVKVDRPTDVLLPPIELDMLSFTPSTDNLSATTPTFSSSTLPWTF